MEAPPVQKEKRKHVEDDDLEINLNNKGLNGREHKGKKFKPKKVFTQWGGGAEGGWGVEVALNL